MALALSRTVWGALAILIGVILRVTLKVPDQDVQIIVDAVTTILTVAGPAIILWGRIRLQPRLDQLNSSQAPNQSPTGETNAAELPVAQPKE